MHPTKRGNARVRHDRDVAALRDDDGRPLRARLGGLVADDADAVADDPAALTSGGRWAVAVTYEGAFTAVRFRHWAAAPPQAVAGPWAGPQPDRWSTSLDEPGYLAVVERIKDRIGRGDLYQANACRILAAEVPDPSRTDLGGLHALLAAGNPAPYEGYLRLPGLQIATASPELLLRRRGATVTTGPIKGTGRTAADLTDKDRAENIMIVDLMRNDLSRVCVPGSVEVPRLLAVEEHPGLVHLVSDVAGRLEPGAGWAEILRALLPPGSVTGAPKSSAVRILAGLEPVPRGPYCGALGWIDVDRAEAVLAVGIRTFWLGQDGLLRFGTGAGITWGSSAAREWRETELKAEHLLQVAALRWEDA
jgi:para-aminobenzoate synthetase component 1